MMRERFTLSCAALLCAFTAMAQRVDNAEYFWDTDPGAGAGNAIDALDGAFNAAVESIFLQTSALPGLGAHKLGIRVRDQQGNWGPAFSTVVVIEPPVVSVPEISLTQAEYFWDSDPGEGNGTPMLAFDGDFNSAFETIGAETAALPSEGMHVIHVRTKDVNGVWSIPFNVVVEIWGGTATFPEINVSAAEYFVNVDPGPGLGTPMLAVDGDFNSAFEAIKGGGIPAPVAAGANVLWLRARDVHDAWGPPFGIVVNIDTTITGTVGVTEPEVYNIRLVPNPTTSDAGFSVMFDRFASSIDVRVVDASGRVVMAARSGSERRIAINLPEIAAGIYHVGVVADGVQHWDRLVVQ